jgi:hypothetical protein
MYNWLKIRSRTHIKYPFSEETSGSYFVSIILVKVF